MRPLGLDRLEPAPDGSLLLTGLLSKGWVARRRKTLTAAEYPGTAVRFEGEIFEVIEALSDPAGGVRYRLAPWGDRHAIRVVESYDEHSEAARQAEQWRRRDAVAKRRASILLAPLLGHLPGPVQRRMESEFGAPARAMTIASALPLLVLAVVSFLAFLAISYGAAVSFFAGWPLLPLPFALYLFVESALRLGIAFLQEEPMGSVPGALLYGLWRRFCDRSGGALRRYAAGPAPKEKENT